MRANLCSNTRIESVRCGFSDDDQKCLLKAIQPRNHEFWIKRCINKRFSYVFSDLKFLFLSIIFFLSTQSFLCKILMISALNSFGMWIFLIIIWTTVSSCTHRTDSIRVLLHVFRCKKYAFRFKQRWRLSEFWKNKRKNYLRCF